MTRRREISLLSALLLAVVSSCSALKPAQRTYLVLRGSSGSSNNDGSDGSRQYIGKYGDNDDFGGWVPSSMLSVAKGNSALANRAAIALAAGTMSAALAGPAAATAAAASLALEKGSKASTGGMPLDETAYTDLGGVKMCRILNGMWQVSGYHGFEPNRYYAHHTPHLLPLLFR